MMTPTEFQALLACPEGGRVEFKSASGGFHFVDSADAGAALAELQQVLPNLSRGQVQTLVRELKKAGEIQVRGTTRAARWFPAALKRNSTQ